ncbi:MAG: hypothetical protein U0228_12115 [Myxococcaceae bacterium]
MKKSKMQGRRPMPQMRTKKVHVEAAPKVLTVGDLISAAYDALGDTEAVVRVLGSNRLSERVGRKIVFI